MLSTGESSHFDVISQFFSPLRIRYGSIHRCFCVTTGSKRSWRMCQTQIIWTTWRELPVSWCMLAWCSRKWGRMLTELSAFSSPSASSHTTCQVPLVLRALLFVWFCCSGTSTQGFQHCCNELTLIGLRLHTYRAPSVATTMAQKPANVLEGPLSCES